MKEEMRRGKKNDVTTGATKNKEKRKKRRGRRRRRWRDKNKEGSLEEEEGVLGQVGTHIQRQDERTKEKNEKSKRPGTKTRSAG